LADYPLYHLVAALIVLIVLSGYFSASETAVMALNRYRLRHLADGGHAGARRAQRLLARPDRFIGLILLGNNFVNILLTQVATLVLLQALGEDDLLVATAAITGVIVIFGEVLPKTLAAVNPERIAYPSSLLLLPLLRVAHPVLVVLNGITGVLLKPFRIDLQRAAVDPLDREELRTVVKEAGALIPQKHRDMLFGILDLEHATVEDIMVPRAEIVAIDLDRAWVDIAEQLKTCRHTRVPCYRGSLDNLVGVLHMRNLGRLFRSGAELDDGHVEALLAPPHFVPVRANLYAQLLNFQLSRQRLALAVDEYGDIEGLVTLDDLLEQVVGKFTTVPQFGISEVYRQADGSFVVDGSANLRELNRAFGWSLPEQGPKTLNGLILEALEDIPDAGTSLRIAEYTIEVVHSGDHAVRSARIYPPAHFRLDPAGALRLAPGETAPRD
jgi:Mg2+/Co2+ transporter CorB